MKSLISTPAKVHLAAITRMGRRGERGAQLVNDRNADARFNAALGRIYLPLAGGRHRLASPGLIHDRSGARS